MQVHVTRVQRDYGAPDAWVVEHRDLALHHNHLPSSANTAHPIHRRMGRTEEIQRVIAVSTDAGLKPRQILALLASQFPGLAITARDVYNEQQRFINAIIGGRSRIEYLFDQLDPDAYFVERQLDHQQRLTHLFIANKKAIVIYSKNPDVILMDCTYRTNRFGMPLSNIVGVTGMNATIHIGQVFLRGEKQGDFAWAATQLKKLIVEHSIAFPQVVFCDWDLALLNALEAIFTTTPVLLCRWHIIKDVETHARVHTFRKELDRAASRDNSPVWKDSAAHRQFCDAFPRVVRSTSVDQYHTGRAELHRLSTSEAAYIDDTWLDIWHMRIAKYWTNTVLHFGMESTSRVEGYHSKMKSWLGSSGHDLLTIHKRLKTWWEQSINEYDTAVANARIKRPHRLSGHLYGLVVKKIHSRTLFVCDDLIATSTASGACSGAYTRTHGLPCVHRLRQLATNGIALQCRDFHPHWWITRSDAAPVEPPTVLEPEIIRARRDRRSLLRREQRLSGSGDLGTRRNPYAFEHSLA